ncbi:MAG: SDR family NAD(P)-dependent oxidoreductase [Micrococcaceae bacterium]
MKATSPATEPRVALVTGGTSGIGAAIAARLVQDGLRVVVTSRSATPSVGTDDVDSTDGDMVAIAADLTAPGEPARVVREVLERFGRLDVLVNNAGRRHAGLIADTPVDEITEVFAINTLAAMAMTSAAVAPMTAQGEGVVINVLSRLATVGVATLTTYSASKGALLAYTRGAAVELAPHGIRVNAVAPGMTTTPLIEDWLSDQEDSEGTLQSVVSQIPLGRLGNPDDTSAAVAYLASPEASYLTGVSIPIDGGYTAQ